MDPALRIFVGILAVAGIAGGSIDLFAPQVAIRWQVRSTERADGIRRSVGQAVGAAIHRGATEPWNDRSARRRVRLIGAFLVLAMAASVAMLVLASTG